MNKPAPLRLAMVGLGAMGRRQMDWIAGHSFAEAAWRRLPGGGPVLINLVHEMGVLRMLFDEITAVQAATSRARRKLQEGDAAALLLHIANGPLRRQLNHLCLLVQGQGEPLVCACDGLQNLRAVKALLLAARTGARVDTDTSKP